MCVSDTSRSVEHQYSHNSNYGVLARVDRLGRGSGDGSRADDTVVARQGGVVAVGVRRAGY